MSPDDNQYIRTEEKMLEFSTVLSTLSPYLTNQQKYIHINYITSACNTHTHTRLMALFPGLPGWAGTRKVKPIWILVKQETVSGSGIS